MSNYSNIEPYAVFSHVAAQHGGPMQYVTKVAQKYYTLGLKSGTQMEKSTEPIKGAILGAVCITAWEGGRFIIKKIKENKQKRLLEAAKEAEESLEECAKVLDSEDVYIYSIKDSSRSVDEK